MDVSGLIFPDTDSDQEGITIIGGEEFDAMTRPLLLRTTDAMNARMVYG